MTVRTLGSLGLYQQQEQSSLIRLFLQSARHVAVIKLRYFKDYNLSFIFNQYKVLSPIINDELQQTSIIKYRAEINYFVKPH